MTHDRQRQAGLELKNKKLPLLLHREEASLAVHAWEDCHQSTNFVSAHVFADSNNVKCPASVLDCRPKLLCVFETISYRQIICILGVSTSQYDCFLFRDCSLQERNCLKRILQAPLIYMWLACTGQLGADMWEQKGWGQRTQVQTGEGKGGRAVARGERGGGVLRHGEDRKDGGGRRGRLIQGRQAGKARREQKGEAGPDPIAVLRCAMSAR